MKVLNDRIIYVDIDDTLVIDGKPNKWVINKIKESNAKGHSVVVWTSNFEGIKHAIKVVSKLGIEDYIDVLTVKPYTIIDDDHLEYYTIIDPVMGV